jgi:hypothetical protein
MRPLLAATVVTGLLALAACSDGDGGDDDDGAGLGTTSSIAPPSAPDVPRPSRAGTGVVVVGERGTGSSFAVTSCVLDPDDPEAAGALLRVTGEGTTASGVPFRVEVSRSATAAAAETFTDLITYTDTARILQVQRFEAAGEVSDLRDPDARGTLLRTRDGGLSATGIAGPPGTDVKGPGLVGLALDVTC